MLHLSLFIYLGEDLMGVEQGTADGQDEGGTSEAAGTVLECTGLSSSQGGNQLIIIASTSITWANHLVRYEGLNFHYVQDPLFD